MPYEAIPDDELHEPQRLIAPAGRDVAATEKILAALPGIAAYGFLLVPDPAHPVATAIAENWSLLDHRSGSRFALVAFQPPKEWAAATVDRWRERLGADFDATWAGWQESYGLEAGAAYDYVSVFRTDPPLRNDDMPCLVIYTDPDDRRAIVRTIPEWSAADLVEFLGSAIDTVLAHLDDPAETGLDSIAAELTSPGAVAKSRLGHLFGRAVDYARAHPAKIVVGAVNGALILSGMGWLPLSVSAIAALKELKSDVGK